MKYIFLTILLVILGFCGYTYFKYNYVVSDGAREGLLNKFSTKGIIFKTNEGELLMPGMVPNMPQMSSNVFYFSALDHNVKLQLDDATGHKIKVHYTQYKGTLPWRGDDYTGKNQEEGQYIVDKVEVVD